MRCCWLGNHMFQIPGRRGAAGRLQQLLVGVKNSSAVKNAWDHISSDQALHVGSGEKLQVVHRHHSFCSQLRYEQIGVGAVLQTDSIHDPGAQHGGSSATNRRRSLIMHHWLHSLRFGDIGLPPWRLQAGAGGMDAIALQNKSTRYKDTNTTASISNNRQQHCSSSSHTMPQTLRQRVPFPCCLPELQRTRCGCWTQHNPGRSCSPVMTWHDIT